MYICQMDVDNFMSLADYTASEKERVLKQLNSMIICNIPLFLIVGTIVGLADKLFG